jgi:hypothetical protein
MRTASGSWGLLHLRNCKMALRQSSKLDEANGKVFGQTVVNVIHNRECFIMR